MKKEELSKILHGLNIPVFEEKSQKNMQGNIH